MKWMRGEFIQIKKRQHKIPRNYTEYKREKF